MSIEEPARLLRGLAAVAFGAAALLGLIAWEHIRALASYGIVCGGATPHCPACPASVAAGLLGVALLAVAARQPRRARVRA